MPEIDEYERRLYDAANLLGYEAYLDELHEAAGITWTCRDPDATWTNREGESCERCGRTMAESREAFGGQIRDRWGPSAG